MNEIKITIEGLSELTEAVRSLAIILWSEKTGKESEQNTNKLPAVPVQGQAMSVPAGTVPVQAPQMPQTAPLQQNVPGQSMPVQWGNPQQQGMPVQQPSPGMQVPTTAAAQEYTIEQLQVAAAGLTSSGKITLVRGILQNFGIQAMTELRKEQYGAFAAALREAGAQI